MRRLTFLISIQPPLAPRCPDTLIDREGACALNFAPSLLARLQRIPRDLEGKKEVSSEARRQRPPLLRVSLLDLSNQGARIRVQSRASMYCMPPRNWELVKPLGCGFGWCSWCVWGWWIFLLGRRQRGFKQHARRATHKRSGCHASNQIDRSVASRRAAGGGGRAQGDAPPTHRFRQPQGRARSYRSTEGDSRAAEWARHGLGEGTRLLRWQQRSSMMDPGRHGWLESVELNDRIDQLCAWLAGCCWAPTASNSARPPKKLLRVAARGWRMGHPTHKPMRPATDPKPPQHTIKKTPQPQPRQ